MIRTLNLAADAAAVSALFTRAADYVMLESGKAPDAAQTQDFFTEAPPGIDPAAGLQVGYELNGNLVAMATVAFGFPLPDDAYIGLLLIDPAHRGKRLGQQMVDHIFSAVRARHATRILVAVLEENPKGHRFWSKMGFTEDLRSQPKLIGLKSHIQIRMVQSL